METTTDMHLVLFQIYWIGFIATLVSELMMWLLDAALSQEEPERNFTGCLTIAAAWWVYWPFLCLEGLGRFFDEINDATYHGYQQHMELPEWQEKPLNSTNTTSTKTGTRKP